MTGPARHGDGTPTPQTYGARPTSALADWWTRAGAFLLDQLVVAGVAFGAALAAATIAGDAGGDTARILVYAIVLPLGFFYAPLLMARSGTRNGQTLGKQVVGIRVVRIDGEAVTFGTGVMRTFVGQQLPIAVTFYLYAVIDYLWPLRDPQNQALHDKIAKTLVLRSAAPPASPLSEEPAAPGWLPPRAPH